MSVKREAHNTMGIHPTAIVDPSAELGEGVEIGPFSIIEKDVRIGAGTTIAAHCFIGSGTTLGRENRLFNSAQIGILPQDLKHVRGVYGKTIIGDKNDFREFVTVSSGTVYANDTDEKLTKIGSGGLYMACTHIAHDCIVGDGVIMANQAALAGHVTVQDRVTIGGLTGVHQFCVLGKMSFIGGMTRVNKDTLPFMIIEGAPARCHGPNTIGLERSGFTKEAIKTIRDVYKLLYRAGLNTTQALERIDAEIEASPERDLLVNFVRASERGISK